MKLTFTLGEGAPETTLEIAGGSIFIGRHDTDIVINDEYCSRLHAQIYVTKSGELHLRDLDSRNGTFLNETRVKDAVLKGGDRIQIGTTVVKILRPTPVRPSAEVPKVAAGALESAKAVVHVWPELYLCYPERLRPQYEIC